MTVNYIPDGKTRSMSNIGHQIDAKETTKGIVEKTSGKQKKKVRDASEEKKKEEVTNVDTSAVDKEIEEAMAASNKLKE